MPARRSQFWSAKVGSKQLSEVPTNSGTGSATTRADVKAQIGKDLVDDFPGFITRLYAASVGGRP